MKLIAVTGGVGCGKSQFGRFLSDLGATVIEADVLARDVIAPGTPGLLQLQSVFSKEYFDQFGNPLRHKIKKLMLKNTSAKQRLESVIHPLVKDAFVSLVNTLRMDDHVQHVFYIIPLFFETNQNRSDFDSLVVVASNHNICIQRIVERDGLSEEEANDLINLQLPIESKIERADTVISNNGTLQMLQENTSNYFTRLLYES